MYVHDEAGVNTFKIKSLEVIHIQRGSTNVSKKQFSAAKASLLEHYIESKRCECS